MNGPGKGDRRRPSSVSDKTFAKNWDAIDWGKKKPDPPKKEEAIFWTRPGSRVLIKNITNY